MEYPKFCYSKDLNNNCIVIKWGVPGYYKTDYPEGAYTGKTIDDMNAAYGITPKQRIAMECCSTVAQNRPYLDWKAHYDMCMKGGKSL